MLFSQSVMSNSLWCHGLQQARLPCPSLSPGQSLLKLMSIESVMSSNHLSLCHPLLLLLSIFRQTLYHLRHQGRPQSFPASRFFLMSQLFRSGGQSIGASAAVLLMSIQGWMPLRSTHLISCCPRDSQESPEPQFKSISSSMFSLLYGPPLISILDYYTDLCQQSAVSAFYTLSRFVIAFL